MQFNSFLFLFGFLPISLASFYLARSSTFAAKMILTIFSLVFYAWWRPVYLFLLSGSIIFNYAVGALIQKYHSQNRRRAVSVWLIFGVVADVALLIWFKYANFLADNLNAAGLQIHLERIALPLAISFFTFQKIAYLVDSARGEAKRMSFLDFCLFASFFPQLIAGPITHYKEIVPQFKNRNFGHLAWRNIMVGLVILAIGLFKKTVIADTLAQFANPLFLKAANGAQLDIASGWLAAITFTFQVYFDFSGYSDMAIGLARMFGVRLPLNFHSPFRASNIADFWRRWHMTLQRFVFAYIFQPLTVPLSRFAARHDLRHWSGFTVAVALPLFITFLILGIWHGAAWTFAIFGLMHAVYVCTNQFWSEREARRNRQYRKLGKKRPEPGPLRSLSGHVLTLVAVLFANVMFRADSVTAAVAIWRGMAGFNLTSVPLPVSFSSSLGAVLLFSILIVFFMPNTQQIMCRFRPALNWPDWKNKALPLVQWTWRPNRLGLAFASATLFLAIMFIQRGQATFIYFNF